MLHTTAVATCTTCPADRFQPRPMASVRSHPLAHPTWLHVSVREATDRVSWWLRRGWCRWRGLRVRSPTPGPRSVAVGGLPAVGLLGREHGGQEAASARATGTVYLPRLRSELAQFSFLSGRASRRQRVRLQGQPGTGEMTGEKRDRDFKRRSRWRGEILSAASSEPALRKLRGHRPRLPAPTPVFRTVPCVCPAFVMPVPASSLDLS